MPPKPRGTGTRGRGRTRGGSSAARSGAAPDGEPMQVYEPQVPTAVMVPNTESKPATEDSNVVSTVEGQNGDNAVPSASTRPPVQRLESLRSNDSASAPPVVRRSASTKGKKATPAAVKPIAARRSKQEREQLQKSLNQREKERLAEKKAEEKAKAKEKPFKRPDRPQPKQTAPIGGPFSLGSVAKEKGSANRITTFGGRATHIKREDTDGEGGMGKGTEGGYISSGDEEGGDIPRKDIDAIEISDDEDANDGAGAEPTMLLPVRIERREHVERTVAINTEASSEAAAKILQQAEATGGEIKAEPDDIVPRKGKGKAKDLEITGERRPYKGMWQDEEEGDVRIKAEPLSDDEAMPDAEPVANSELIEPKVDPTKLKKEPKATTRSSKKAEPVLQTEEEKQEHARFQLFQQAVRFELGPDGEETAEPRSESTYIFQLPPIMAQAKLQDIKTEPEAKPLPQPGVKPEKKTAKTEQTKLQPKPVLPEDAAVGKIRVHESGRTTLVWGGKVYDLIASNPADAVGEIVGVEHVEESLRVVPEDMGDSSDLGRLKGKFVALPSWKAML